MTIVKHRFLRLIFFLSCIFCVYITGARESINQSKPFFISSANKSVANQSEYYYQFSAKDSLNNIISFAALVLPSWLYFNATNHSIRGKALKTGQYFIDIIAYNKTDTAHQQFALTVTDKKTTSILCLGNSITNGTNKYNSYRRALWQRLHTGNYNFDFIGSWDKHHMGGDVPDPDFDMDHEGHSGWRFDDIFNPPSWDSAGGNINSWLQSYKPDIVLVELGTNDVFQCRTVKDMIGDLQKLTGLLRQTNSSVKIFLAQIPPLGKEWSTKKLCGDSTDYDQAIHNLNKAFVEFAKMNSIRKSPVIIVDQYSGVNTDTEMYDDIHPNEVGEKRMAEKWFNAIRQYLNKLQN